jgi:hypothetical protein
MDTIVTICVMVVCVPLFPLVGLLVMAHYQAARFRHFEEQGIPIQTQDAGTAHIPLERGMLFLSIVEGRNYAYTAMEAPHVDRSNLAFTIVRRGWGFFPDAQIGGSGSYARLGMREICSGDPHIDQSFRVRGNDETVVRALLANEQIRRLLLHQRPAAFGALPANAELWPLTGTAYPRHRDGVPALLLVERMAIGDATRMKALIALFEATRHELARLGAIQ